MGKGGDVPTKEVVLESTRCSRLGAYDALLWRGRFGQSSAPQGQLRSQPQQASRGAVLEKSLTRFLEVFLSSAPQSKRQRLLSLLIGLDRNFPIEKPKKPDAGNHHFSQTPSHTFSWVGALQHAKLSHLFKGMHITANMGFGILFAFSIFCFFLLYFVRHHAPDGTVFVPSPNQPGGQTVQPIQQSMPTVPLMNQPQSPAWTPSALVQPSVAGTSMYAAQENPLLARLLQR